MRKILKLLCNEIKVMRSSVLLTALALILFTATLFSVIFVYTNLSELFFLNLDKDGGTLSFLVHSIKYSEITKDNLDGLFNGDIEGLTYNAVLSNDKGEIFKTEQNLESDGIYHIKSYSGKAFIPTNIQNEYFMQLEQIIAGSFPQKAYEIAVNAFIANSLDLSINDNIYINNSIYNLVGIFDENSLPNYIVAVDNETQFDLIEIELNSSISTYELYTKLGLLCFEVTLAPLLQSYIQILSSVNGFLIAIACILLVVNFVLLYSMFSIIIINRRAYICKLKVLGCQSITLFAVFYLLLIGIVLVVDILAYILSLFVSGNIVGLCSNLFNMEFDIGRNPLVMAIHFIIASILLIAIYLVNINKIKDSTVLNTLKGE